MNEEAADPNCISCMDYSPRSVLKQCPTNTLTVVRLRDRKPCQHHNRDWIWHIASKATRRRRDRDCARCQRIVSDHRAGLADYERARSSG